MHKVCRELFVIILESEYAVSNIETATCNEHHFVYFSRSNKLTSDASVDVSSAAASNFRLSSLRNFELEEQSSEDHCAMVLADHLRELADECPHLCFGTYNGGSNSASSVMLASNTSTSGLKEKADARHFLYHFKLLIYSYLSIVY